MRPGLINARGSEVRAVIDHIGYTVADFKRERAKAELIAMGVKNVRDGGLKAKRKIRSGV
jgi:hypothetical protein